MLRRKESLEASALLVGGPGPGRTQQWWQCVEFRKLPPVKYACFGVFHGDVSDTRAGAISFSARWLSQESYRTALLVKGKNAGHSAAFGSFCSHAVRLLCTWGSGLLDMRSPL